MNSKDLYSLIQQVDITSSNPVLPCLDSVRLTVKNGKVLMYSTNLQETKVLQVDRDWDDIDILIPPQVTNTLKTFNDDIKIIVSDGSLKIESKTGNYKSGIHEVNDYPSIPDVEGDSFILDPDFASSLSDISKFATTDELRLAMTGVCFDLSGSLKVVSTDAQKLIVRKESVDFRGEEKFIVPSSMVRSMKDSYVLPVEVTVGEKQVKFESGNKVTYVRRIDANYPDYDDVIPNNTNHVKVDRLELTKSLQRLSLYTNKTTNQCILDVSEGNIKISAIDLDYGNEGEETIDCENDKDIKAAFSCSNLITALNSIGEDEVDMYFGEPSQALVLKNETDTILIMPIMMI